MPATKGEIFFAGAIDTQLTKIDSAIEYMRHYCQVGRDFFPPESIAELQQVMGAIEADVRAAYAAIEEVICRD